MLVYMDESGDHNLDKTKFDNYYNIFVLGAVFFTTQEYYDAFDVDFKNLKRDLFGSEDYIIHTAEINRPSKSKNSLTKNFADKAFRKVFYDRISNIISSSNFYFVACVIDKNEHVDRYGESAFDPYMLSFENILNRILFRTSSLNGCRIFPEQRDSIQNERLLIAFERTKRLGTRFCNGAEVDSKVIEFVLVPKEANYSGSQLADLLVTPIGRHCVGKPPKPEGNEVPFSLIKKKIPSQCLTYLP